MKSSVRWKQQCEDGIENQHRLNGVGEERRGANGVERDGMRWAAQAHVLDERSDVRQR